MSCSAIGGRIHHSSRTEAHVPAASSPQGEHHLGGALQPRGSGRSTGPARQPDRSSGLDLPGLLMATTELERIGAPSECSARLFRPNTHAACATSAPECCFARARMEISRPPPPDSAPSPPPREGPDPDRTAVPSQPRRTGMFLPFLLSRSATSAASSAGCSRTTFGPPGGISPLSSACPQTSRPPPRCGAPTPAATEWPNDRAPPTSPHCSPMTKNSPFNAGRRPVRATIRARQRFPPEAPTPTPGSTRSATPGKHRLLLAWRSPAVRGLCAHL